MIQPLAWGIGSRVVGCAKNRTNSLSLPTIAASSAAVYSAALNGYRVAHFTHNASTVGTITSATTEHAASSTEHTVRGAYEVGAAHNYGVQLSVGAPSKGRS